MSSSLSKHLAQENEWVCPLFTIRVELQREAPLFVEPSFGQGRIPIYKGRVISPDGQLLGTTLESFRTKVVDELGALALKLFPEARDLLYLPPPKPTLERIVSEQEPF